MADITLRNQTKHMFIDVSSEDAIKYVFPGGDVVLIQDPQWLSVSASENHRILDRRGVSHYIPFGWIHISWGARPGQPHFVK